MRHINLRKTLCIAAVISATHVGTGALADQLQDTHGPGYYGMWPGMLVVYGSGYDLHLTPKQGSKIAKIQDDFRGRYSELMDRILGERSKLTLQFIADRRDEKVLAVIDRKISELLQQLSELSLNAQKQMDAILTKEQGDNFRQVGWGPSR